MSASMGSSRRGDEGFCTFKDGTIDASRGDAGGVTRQEEAEDIGPDSC